MERASISVRELIAHRMRVGPAPGIRPHARAPHIIARDPSATSLRLGTPGLPSGSPAHDSAVIVKEPVDARPAFIGGVLCSSIAGQPRLDRH
ncbi:MAG: hypothetical protein Q8M66_03150 [Actinomycetota bacterium]|nr:hypothetical protein [Actinomycetota bacterium]